MVRLQVMQRLTAQGVAPAEAAAWARRSSATGTEEYADPAPPRAAPESSPVVVPDPRHAPPGGGQTIALGSRVSPAARGLARAAMRLDGPSMRYILESAVTGRGVIPAWEHVIMPVLIGIGERYEATSRYIEVEHLLSRTVTEVLATVPRPPRDREPRVLLAGAEEEQHTLPLEALTAALAEAGIPSHLFGARVPAPALLDAVRRTRPAVVVLWSQTASTGDPEQLGRLLEVPQRPRVVAAAGPGWLHTATLPPEVITFSNLAGAVRVIAAATSA